MTTAAHEPVIWSNLSRGTSGAYCGWCHADWPCAEFNREQASDSVIAMTTGIERRNEGWSAVQAADVAPHRNYKQYVIAALEHITRMGGEFTSEDVEHLADQLAPKGVRPHSPNLIPATVGGWASAKRIRLVGITQSTKPSRRYGRIGVYVTTRRAA
jgi:hypothetical protein